MLKGDGSAVFKTPAADHSFICMSDAGYHNFTIVETSTETSVEVLQSPSSSVANGTIPVQLIVIEFFNLQLQAFIKDSVSPSANTGLPPFATNGKCRIATCRPYIVHF